MATHAETPAHDAHGHGHGHDDHHHEGGGHHGTMRDYVTGFILSAILTAIPFWLIMGDVFRSPTTAAVVVLLFAVAQIFVHMIYFLHMSPKSEGGWTMLAMIFTVVLVVITLAGSFWVMFHLHANMTPGLHEMNGTTPLVQPENGAR
ncbi:cytochrome o ubiquinol oxidase subunit IV [Chenggangzhangella methanolivorans]|uniref:Cytochrome bo(3) ubiquinol oxidase subunit 4 n=1 Tax=Chenggangzhangella methanolivorans TaxID=1437009 RepID=A0A9E6RC89_9HYPH|nr:cytochrome o ubiquinol oxidase subunit IV [Chenggangzhangella methanolivorans]QZN98415.1 cytochrome o ubiquinol oxidase subunit IV [Chenggangzhangella methanolivorans]